MRVSERNADLEPTEKQVALIFKLAAERELSEKDELMVRKVSLLSRSLASQLIGRLMKAPKTGSLSQDGLEVRPYMPPLELGMYHTDTGEVLKVFRGAKSGAHLVSRLVMEGEKYKWEYLAGTGRVVAGDTELGLVFIEPMALEEARTWGKMMGLCIVCTKKLEAEKQVGIHLACAKKEFKR